MKKAFTLVELIFVIVVIGLLAAIAVPKFMTVEENAKIKPLQEISNQVVNKATERYQLIQDANITRAIHADNDLMKYLDELTSNIDKHFLWDANESIFQVNYDPKKKVLHNNQTTTDDEVNMTDKGAMCVKVERTSVKVPVTAEANVTRYEFNITEFNVSCITAAE